MTPDGLLMVASDAVTDANVLERLLHQELKNVVINTEPERFVEQFETHRPPVLILAYERLQIAERQYLALFQRGNVVHALAHRTIVLCSKDELRPVYEQCKKRRFDDYMLFWPMPHDTTRLNIEVAALV